MKARGSTSETPFSVAVNVGACEGGVGDEDAGEAAVIVPHGASDRRALGADGVLGVVVVGEGFVPCFRGGGTNNDLMELPTFYCGESVKLGGLNVGVVVYFESGDFEELLADRLRCDAELRLGLKDSNDGGVITNMLAVERLRRP